MSLTRRSMMGLRAGGGSGNLTIVEVTLDQDYTGFSSTAFSLFAAAVGTDFFAFCISYLPESHTMAESDAILYSGARLPALHVIPGSTSGKYFDVSKDTAWRTFRQDLPQGPYSTSTSTKGIAGSKYKIWGWNK